MKYMCIKFYVIKDFHYIRNSRKKGQINSMQLVNDSLVIKRPWQTPSSFVLVNYCMTFIKHRK